MENKTLEFVKNNILAGVGFVGGGIAGAELSDLLTDSPVTITVSSLAGQYALGYPLFMALHAYDNSERYKEAGRWQLKKLAGDAARLVFSVGLAEIIYLIGRSYLMHRLLQEDYSPTGASLLSDAVTVPFYFCIAIPIARMTGFIREDSTP